jgi:hypothetical protein
MRAAVIYFDVKNVDLAGLKKLDLDEGDEWTTLTGQCLTKDGHLKAYRGERNALELVMGKLVHNPDQVENHQATSEAFEDVHKQYAFRVPVGNLLFADKKKISVALLNVHLDVANDEDI